MRNSLHETPHHVKKTPNFLHDNLYHVKKMANSLHEKAEKGGAGCLILDVEGTEFPAPLAQLRIGRANGAGNLDIQNPGFKIPTPWVRVPQPVGI